MNTNNASNGKSLNSWADKVKPDTFDDLQRKGQDQKNSEEKLTKGGN